MTKQNQPAVDDAIILGLSEMANDITTSVELTEDHAVLVLGVKFSGDPTDPANERDTATVQSYLNVSGFYGILAEGLYQELLDQAANGQSALFATLRGVVRDVERDLGLLPDEELSDDASIVH